MADKHFSQAFLFLVFITTASICVAQQPPAQKAAIDAVAEADGQVQGGALKVLRSRSGTRLLLREWTDVTGTFNIRASLQNVDANGNAVLRKLDGIVLSVPLNKLSATDRDYVTTSVRVSAEYEKEKEDRLSRFLTAFVVESPISRDWTTAWDLVLPASRLIEVQDSNVYLQREDGRITVLPMKALCDADREFIWAEVKIHEDVAKFRSRIEAMQAGPLLHASSDISVAKWRSLSEADRKTSWQTLAKVEKEFESKRASREQLGDLVIAGAIVSAVAVYGHHKLDQKLDGALSQAIADGKAKRTAVYKPKDQQKRRPEQAVEKAPSDTEPVRVEKEGHLEVNIWCVREDGWKVKNTRFRFNSDGHGERLFETDQHGFAKINAYPGKLDIYEDRGLGGKNLYGMYIRGKEFGGNEIDVYITTPKRGPLEGLITPD